MGEERPGRRLALLRRPAAVLPSHVGHRPRGRDPVTGPETITGWTVPGDQPITIELRPVPSWELFHEGRYVGQVDHLIGLFRWQAHGYGQDLDEHRVAAVADFDSREEAVQWLLDGYLSRAES